MRTEAIAKLVGRLERDRDNAWREVRYLQRKRRDDYEAQVREFELRLRQLQAMNEHLVGMLSTAAALDTRPMVIPVPCPTCTLGRSDAARSAPRNQFYVGA